MDVRGEAVAASWMSAREGLAELLRERGGDWFGVEGRDRGRRLCGSEGRGRRNELGESCRCSGGCTCGWSGKCDCDCDCDCDGPAEVATLQNGLGVYDELSSSSSLLLWVRSGSGGRVLGDMD